VSDHLLDNAAWHALGTHHATFAVGHGRARRYAPDVSVFAAVDEVTDAAWSDLGTLAGEARFVCLFRREVADPPPGWKVLVRARAHQMVADPGRLADIAPAEVRVLDTSNVAEMLALVALTKPGPFELRTIELGRYLGVFADGRLVAMAGERFHLDGHTEVSAVCTHPDAQGRGLGAALTHAVAAGIVARGERAFLHVAEDNNTARRVYERLGFTTRCIAAFVAMQAPV